MRLHNTLLVVSAVYCSLSPVSGSPLSAFLDIAGGASAALLGTPSLAERQVVNCTDPQADFSEECWGMLNLTSWLQNWNQTTRICSTVDDGTDSDGSECCKPDQPWTTCFLHLAHGVAGSDCSEINAQPCSWDAEVAVDPSIAPQVRYVMRNIYGMLPRAESTKSLSTSVLICRTVVNNFFTTYYEALIGATGRTTLAITSIVNVLDPNKPTGVPWASILSVVSFGLAFLGAPGLAVVLLESSLTSTVKLVSQAFLISLQQAPGVTKALFPQGTEDTKTVQIGDLQTDLGGAADQFSSMINRALELLMSDVPSFIYFVQSGKYSSDINFSLPNQTDGLDIALKIYVTSMAMWGNGWFAFPNVGPYEPDDVSGGFGCTFAENGVCTDDYGHAYYLSPDTKRMYSLINLQYTAVSPYNLTELIVNNKWAPLNVLFDGGFNCTASGKAGSSDVQFNFDGTLDIACISQLPIYISCDEACPSPYVNGSCPFGNTDNAKGQKVYCKDQ